MAKRLKRYETQASQPASHSSLTPPRQKISKGELVDITGDLEAEEEARQNDAITQSILQHLYREGDFAAADMLAQEMGDMADVPELKQPFVTMHGLVQALREHHIQPAIQWAEAHAASLGDLGVELCFQLHSLAYIDLLKAAHTAAGEITALTAMRYARQWVLPFLSRYPSEVETLMGALAFVSTLRHSPYQTILLHDLWRGCEEALVVAYCSVLGLPRESSLRLCVSIGTVAWPKLSRVLAMMRGKPGVDWSLSPTQELPIKVDTTDQQRFHSVFVCPILRQQATEANPPMMMSCGHVICQEALNRLSRGNPNYRIKCPYCPAESTATMAIKIVF